MGRKPRLTLDRNNAGRMFVGLDEYDERGWATRSCVLSSADKWTADEVMRRRFRDMVRLMGDAVEAVDLT